ncbi:hypothetical protein [Nostoc sp.]|uniref:hypothetical protein n=1 Tax=Nostoc sp. TaxID=1180 RepID=UPI002FF4EEAD
MTYYYDALNFDKYSKDEQKQILKDAFNGIAKPQKTIKFSNELRGLLATERTAPPYRTSRYMKPKTPTKKITLFIPA